jgi:uncharacterized membrane protein HdeD (DUF308 family)
MVITNIYVRLILGSYVIIIGLLLLKIYIDKDKETIWGSLYRIEEKGFNRSTFIDKKDKIYSKIYIILGCFSIIAGLVVIFFGFRNTIL